jgi:hypothetical protein
VTVTLIATDVDGPDDIAATWYRLDGGPIQQYVGPFEVTGQGPTGLGGHWIVFWSEDLAGNVEPFVVGVNGIGVGIDETPPVITARRTAPNSNGWNRTRVIVQFDCSDSLSGIATFTPGPAAVFILTEGQNQSVTGSCVDFAGHSATLTVEDINIDRTPPTIAMTRSPGPNVNGWNNQPVVVAFECLDSLSGLAGGSPPPVTLSMQGAHQSATATCVDLAGNSKAATASEINIDTTPPVITLAAAIATLWPPNGKLVADQLFGTIADALSGVDVNTLSFHVIDEYGSVQPTGPIVLTPDGRFSFTVMLEASRFGSDRDGRRYEVVVTANDRAGNTSSSLATVLVPHDQRP